MNVWKFRAYIALWLAAIAGVGSVIWTMMLDVLGTQILAIPAALVPMLLLFWCGPPRETRKPGVAGLPSRRFVTAAAFTAGLCIGAVCLLGYIKHKFVERMPDMNRVLAYDPAVTTQVYDRNGELFCSFTTQNRVRVPIEKVSPRIIDALVAAEDERFYQHHGIDPIGMARAMTKNVGSRLRGSSSTQGGSTLTQQVVKQVLIGNSERTIRRKVQEVILAVELERRLSKAQILQIYVNQVFMGHYAYGFEAAMNTYFGKTVSEPTLAEAAIIAGLPQAPSRYSRFDKELVPVKDAEGNIVKDKAGNTVEKIVDHYRESRARMRYVLDRMVATKKITEAQRKKALAEELTIITASDPLNATSAPYVCDMVRSELQKMLGRRAISDQGFTVVTTIDMEMQRKAEAAVRLGLIDLERRLGFAGAEGHDSRFEGKCPGPVSSMGDGAIDSAVVMRTGAKPVVCLRGGEYPMHPEDVARIAQWVERGHPGLVPGDTLAMRLETIVEQTVKGPVTKRYALPARRTGGAKVRRSLQASMVVVDPRSGDLMALVGGYDFGENQFNNAVMAERQVGSAFKPIIYLTGLMRGLTVVDKFVDKQVCAQTASGLWCPTNYKDEFMGEVDLRTALAKSLNSISVQIGMRYGVDNIIRTARALGIQNARLDRALPITVGSEDITPWEMTYAYASIAAGGKKIPRREGANRAGLFIAKVVSRSGETLYELKRVPREEWPQAVPAPDAYALTYLMKGVVEQGTGQRVQELRRPAAGKTGTTNNFRDAWFMGFTTDLVAGVWVGRQSSHYSIGGDATGGSVALPMWLAFMKAGHPDTPTTDFAPPPGIAFVPTPTDRFIPFQRLRIPEDALIDARGLDDPL